MRQLHPTRANIARTMDTLLYRLAKNERYVRSRSVQKHSLNSDAQSTVIVISALRDALIEDLEQGCLERQPIPSESQLVGQQSRPGANTHRLNFRRSWRRE